MQPFSLMTLTFFLKILVIQNILYKRYVPFVDNFVEKLQNCKMTSIEYKMLS